MAERSGVPVEVLRALEASGLLRPHHLEAGDRYSDADVRFVRNVLTLLGVGLSLEDLMRIARQQLETSDALGPRRDGRLVRAGRVPPAPQRRRGGRPRARGRGSPASIRALAAIVGQLVAYRVERAVLDAAHDEIAAHGTDAEIEALARSLGSGRDDDLGGTGDGSAAPIRARADVDRARPTGSVVRRGCATIAR